MSDLNEKVKELYCLIQEQAEDERIWFESRYITEAILQSELRRLHACVEEMLRAFFIEALVEISLSDNAEKESPTKTTEDESDE